MPILNADIPPFQAFVRADFLYDFDPPVEADYHSCLVHGVCCIPGRCLTFHVLMDNGAHIGRVPIHGIATFAEAPEVEVWVAQTWDCFSYQFSVHEFSWLSGSRVRAHLANKEVCGGNYAFTVDYFGNAESENAGDAGWKCHHILELDNGIIAALPNNRLAFAEPSLVRPFPADAPPPYRTMQRTWSCEEGGKWRTDESDKFFYNVEQCVVR